MNNNNKINMIAADIKTGIKHPEKNSALNKLNAFNDKMSKSDFNNSYTRYSIELKLVDESLKELSESDSKDITEQLMARRQFLLEKLRSYGVSYR